jgi:tetrahydromethanopterin S-methyltransferase subunit B
MISLKKIKEKVDELGSLISDWLLAVDESTNSDNEDSDADET